MRRALPLRMIHLKFVFETDLFPGAYYIFDFPFDQGHMFQQFPSTVQSKQARGCGQKPQPLATTGSPGRTAVRTFPQLSIWRENTIESRRCNCKLLDLEPDEIL
jgi:hypothetical protein